MWPLRGLPDPGPPCTTSTGRPRGLPLASQYTRLPSPTSSSPWSYTCGSGNGRRSDTTDHATGGHRSREMSWSHRYDGVDATGAGGPPPGSRFGSIDRLGAPLTRGDVLTANVIDGAAVANRILSDTAAHAAQFTETTGRKPCSATVLVGDDPASHTYVRMKANRCRTVGLHAHVGV